MARGVKYPSEEERLAARRRQALAGYHKMSPAERKSRASRYYKKKKAERDAAAVLWGKNHPDSKLDSQLKYNFGITLDEYRKMEARQEGKCAICGSPPRKGEVRLSVDHDHVSGKVRRLLCRNCNSGLGFFQDSVELLVKACEYLRGHAV